MSCEKFDPRAGLVSPGCVREVSSTVVGLDGVHHHVSRSRRSHRASSQDTANQPQGRRPIGIARRQCDVHVCSTVACCGPRGVVPSLHASLQGVPRLNGVRGYLRPLNESHLSVILVVGVLRVSGRASVRSRQLPCGGKNECLRRTRGSFVAVWRDRCGDTVL